MKTAVIFLFTILLSISALFAQDKDKFEALFKKGDSLYVKQKYYDALKKFKAAKVFTNNPNQIALADERIALCAESLNNVIDELGRKQAEAKVAQDLAKKLMEDAIKERNKNKDLKRAFQISANATVKASENPTMALRLAIVADTIAQHEDVITNVVNKIISENNDFYKIIVQSNGNYINSIDMNPERHLLYSNGITCHIRYSDSVDKQIINTEFNITNAIYAADYKSIITADAGGLILRWNLSGKCNDSIVTNETIRHSNTSRWEAPKVVFSNDRQLFLYVEKIKYDSASMITLYNMKGEILKSFSNKNAYVNNAAFSNDNKKIITCADDSTTTIWSSDGDSLYSLRGHKIDVTSAAFSPDGKKIVTSSSDKTIKIWTIGDSKPIIIYDAHDGAINTVNFSPDGNYIISGGNDSKSKLWDLNGVEINAFRGLSGGISHIKFTNKQNAIFTVSYDGTVCLWRLFKIPIHKYAHPSYVVGTSFSNSGDSILTACYDGKIRLISSKGDTLQTYLANTTGVYTAKFFPDGRNFISTGDSTVIIWNTATKAKNVLKRHHNTIMSSDISQSGEYFLTGAWDSLAILWRKNGTLVRQYLHSRLVIGVSFSPNEKQFASGCSDSTFNLWSIDNAEKPIIKQKLNGEVWSVDFSNDGKQILIGCSNGETYIWFTGEKKMKSINTQIWPVRAVAFSNSGNAILIAGYGNKVVLMDTTYREIQTFATDGYTYFYDCKFSANDRSIIAGATDNNAYIWNNKLMVLQESKSYLEDLTIEQLLANKVLNSENIIEYAKTKRSGKFAIEAGNYFKYNGPYRTALYCYLYALTLAKPSETKDIKLSLAECYKTLGVPDSAIYFYNKAYLADTSNFNPLLLISEIYIAQQDTVKAIENYKYADKEHPNQYDIYNKLFYLYRDCNKFDLAVNYYLKNYEKTKHTDFLYKICYMYLNLAKPDTNTAIKYYKQILKDNPSETTALDYIAHLYQQQGKYNEAVDALYSYYQQDTSNTDQLYKIADLYQEQGKHTDAIKLHSTIYQRDVTNTDELFKIAELHLLNNDTSKTFEVYQNILTDNPENTQCLEKISKLYYNQHNYKQAIASYRKLHDIDPTNTAPLYEIAQIRLIQKDTTNAFQQLAEILKVDSLATRAMYKLANLYMKQKKYNLARQLYESIYKTDKYEWISLYKIAEIYSLQGDNNKAIKQLENSVEIYKSDSNNWSREEYIQKFKFLLADAYYTQNQVSKAKEIYAGMDLWDTSYEAILENTRTIYREAGNYQQVINSLLKLSKIKPNIYNYYGSLSFYYIFVNQFNKAIEMGNKALAIDSSQTWIRTNVMHGYLFMGKYDEALEILKQYGTQMSSTEVFYRAILSDYEALDNADVTTEFMRDQMEKVEKQIKKWGWE